MKILEVTTKIRAYSEEEARDFLDNFKAKSSAEGYIVGANGYTYKSKKSKGEIIDEAWICKCTAIYNEVWD